MAQSNEIVDQAFFNFQTENCERLDDGQEFDKNKFIKAIQKRFKRLPTRQESVALIVKEIKWSDCIQEVA